MITRSTPAREILHSEEEDKNSCWSALGGKRHAVAPRPLRVVQCGIGSGEHLVAGRRTVVARDAAAQRDPNRRAVDATTTDAATAVRSLSHTSLACSGVAPGRTTANSSPPNRAI